ncbi:hypothetical protein [uncultured Ruegeria sp.]|uniref:hypothetical protein n=1 Tax=uncultured Ruegeria sp. TaxID=259304 RepID=UPI002603CECC|nr:hypothetical protein [uncultured Ruegeria sp.]
MKKILIFLLFPISILLLCYQSYNVIKIKHQRDVYYSYTTFFEDAAKHVCLSREAVIEAAKSQGFWYIEEGKGTAESLDDRVPIGTVNLLKVEFKPDPFLAPAIFTFFPFGEDGCWISGK